MRRVKLQTKYSPVEGRIEVLKYGNGTDALLIDDEVMSINLQAYGLVPPAGFIYVKDYSEHEGLADALVAAGVVEKLTPVQFGFGSGYLCRIITDEEAANKS